MQNAAKHAKCTQAGRDRAGRRVDQPRSEDKVAEGNQTRGSIVGGAVYLIGIELGKVLAHGSERVGLD